jgi:PAS domain-containing protein
MAGSGRPQESEPSDPGIDNGILEGVLAAVGDPAAVCDSAGRIRAWNDAFADRVAAEVPLGESSLGQLVTWDDENALASVVDGEAATAPVRLRSDGRRYNVQLDRSGTVVPRSSPSGSRTPTGRCSRRRWLPHRMTSLSSTETCASWR